MTTIPPTAAPRRPRGWWYALGTVLSAAAGAGLGHLVAGFVSPESSPVLAVGSTVIDLTPTPVKEWAVAQFGTADKPILIGSVGIGTLLIAGGIGFVARSHRTLGLALLGALAMTSVFAAVLRPASTSVAMLPGFVTAVAGVFLASWFLGLLDRLGAADRDPLAGAGTDNTAYRDGRSAFSLWSWNPDYPDPENWVAGLFNTGGANNHYGVSDPKLDDLYKKAAFNTNDEERRSQYREINKLLSEDPLLAGPILYQESFNYIVKPKLHGPRESAGPLDAFLAGDWNVEAWYIES